MADPLDLCAVCIAVVWPGITASRSMGHSYYHVVQTNIPGQAPHGGAPTIEELAAGATADVPGGMTMPMRAVTTVEGTRVCHRHASDVLEAAARRPVVVNR